MQNAIQRGERSRSPEQRSNKPPTPNHTAMNSSQSHRPSFHPVLHLSSQNRQSNSCFPSFRLTSLCASQSHQPKSFLPPNFGWFRPLGCAIHVWKSSAHTQHGYSLEKNFRNPRMLSWCSVFAFSGYVAAIECRRVQVERPSCSTSGGQSGGIVLGEEVAGAARGVVGVVLVVLVVLAVLEGELELSALACLVRLRQAATEVQVRHLVRSVSFRRCRFNSSARVRTACHLCRGQRPWATGPWCRRRTLCARSLRGSG